MGRIGTHKRFGNILSDRTAELETAATFTVVSAQAQTSKNKQKWKNSRHESQQTNYYCTHLVRACACQSLATPPTVSPTLLLTCLFQLQSLIRAGGDNCVMLYGTVLYWRRNLCMYSVQRMSSISFFLCGLADMLSGDFFITVSIYFFLTPPRLLIVRSDNRGYLALCLNNYNATTHTNSPLY